MTGVEILDETQVVAESAFGWGAFWIAGSIVFSIFIIIGIVASITFCPDLELWLLVIVVGIVVGIIVGLFFGFLFGECFKTPTKYETHYQVIIDDSVSMTEFLDKYEIINTEGKILTIRERD